MPTNWTQDWSSAANPLRIDNIAVGNAGGMIGITSCPGAPDSWREANLVEDLKVIFRWKPRAILTLIQDHERGAGGVSELGAQIGARGIDWHHLPIVDFRPPDEEFDRQWKTLGPELCSSIKDGARVLVHCYAGLGRSGSVAALMLMGLGIPAIEAIERVRTARPGAIQTRDQERYVLEFSPPPALR